MLKIVKPIPQEESVIFLLKPFGEQETESKGMFSIANTAATRRNKIESKYVINATLVKSEPPIISKRMPKSISIRTSITTLRTDISVSMVL